jgi:hypothetical protein
MRLIKPNYARRGLEVILVKNLTEIQKSIFLNFLIVFLVFFTNTFDEMGLAIAPNWILKRI